MLLAKLDTTHQRTLHSVYTTQKLAKNPVFHMKPFLSWVV